VISVAAGPPMTKSAFGPNLQWAWDKLVDFYREDYFRRFFTVKSFTKIHGSHQAS